MSGVLAGTYNKHTCEINVRENQSGIDNPKKTGNIGYTRHKTKKNKTKNTTPYVLDTTIHKTQDEDKKKQKNKTHNTICDGHHYTHIITNDKTCTFLQAN
jgi:hypothetical protein